MRTLFLSAVLMTLELLSTTSLLAGEMPCLNPKHPDRQPDTFNGRLIPPDIGCFWPGAGSLESVKAFVDHTGKNGAFDAFCLTVRGLTSLRDNPQNVDIVQKGTAYALDRYGIGAHLDIDLRIARLDFEKEHPTLLQEELFLEEKENGSSLEFVMQARDLFDHYTGIAPYYVKGSRFLKAWQYRKNKVGEVVPESSRDISSLAKYEKRSAKECRVSFPEKTPDQAGFVCIAVAFSYRYPDLFSKEAFDSEATIYKKYSVVPATGTGKDEFGMLPAFMKGIDTGKSHWYSETMRKSYALRSGGRDLIDDGFLMYLPQQGKESLRGTVYDHYRRMTFDRMLEYETQHYDLTKQYWGKTAFVGVHGTWFPWPNINEFRKNGLYWWKMKRDFAQTDEYVPFCCRNGMAKGTNTCWINMFYATSPDPYLYEHWTAALSSGRVHLHGIYPSRPDSPKERHLSVINAGAGRIRTAVRLLNYISGSPIESTVAVVFGHFGAMYPARPEYKKVGVDLCDRFAEQGWPADLIPSDEINTCGLDGHKRWTRNADGYLQYGSQAYRYVIFYGDGVSDHADFIALEKLAGQKSRTEMIRIAATASKEETFSQIEKILSRLQTANVPGHTPWERDRYQFNDTKDEISVRPKLRGFARLIDNTFIWVAAEKKATGDLIDIKKERVFSNDGKTQYEISMKCTGLGACRMNARGEVEALAAAGLLFFQTGDFSIQLKEPTDLVLLRDTNGLHGILQSKSNILPEELKKITPDWKWLKSNFPE